MLDPSDFIDWDEGRDFPEAFFAEANPCENCGKPVQGERVWIPGFDYWACSDCAEESRILFFAEENCPTLYDAIMRAKSVQQVQFAFRTHKESCPKCNPLPARKGPSIAIPESEQEEREAA